MRPSARVGEAVVGEVFDDLEDDVIVDEDLRARVVSTLAGMDEAIEYANAVCDRADATCDKLDGSTILENRVATASS